MNERARVRICHLSSVHKAFDIRILYKECRTLASLGYDVTFVVPHTADEVAEGVRIKAVRPPASRLDRMARTTWRVYRAALELDADLYHFHDPELIPAALLLKRTGKPVVYDVHEDLPNQVYGKDWIPPAIRPPVASCARFLERLVIHTVDGVIAATPAIGRRLGAGAVTVQNFPTFGEGDPEPRVSYRQRGPFAVYHGGISKLRSAVEMVDAFGRIPAALGARLLLAGSYSSPGLKAELETRPGWKQVDDRGWLSRPEVEELTGSARLGLVLFHPVPNHVEAQPNKLFEYMAAGLPLVASDFPLWREIIGEVGCGILVNPLDAGAIAGAITWLLENPAEAEEMGRRGREAVRARFSWAPQGEKLAALYSTLLR